MLIGSFVTDVEGVESGAVAAAAKAQIARPNNWIAGSDIRANTNTSSELLLLLDEKVNNEEDSTIYFQNLKHTKNSGASRLAISRS